MVDFAPLLSVEHNAVHAYGNGGFRIGGVHYTGSGVVFQDRVLGWPIRIWGKVTRRSLHEVYREDPSVDILVIGSGVEVEAGAHIVAKELASDKIRIEVMNTGAACRTFNVLLSEGRHIAAALIAI